MSNLKENSDNDIGIIVNLSEKIVAKYVALSIIPRREKEDATMTLISRFIEKKPIIDIAFKGRAKVSTHYLAVLNRMCLEWIGQEKKNWAMIKSADSNPNFEINHSAEDSVYKKRILMNDVQIRLQHILLFFGKEEPKTSLFLKHIFNIEITDQDILRFNAVNFNQIKEILAKTNDSARIDKYNQLAEIIFLTEDCNTSPDAMRIWLNKQIATILHRLNSNGLYQFNRETLSILFESIDM